MNINIGLKSVAAKAATAATVPTPLFMHKWKRPQYVVWVENCELLSGSLISTNSFQRQEWKSEHQRQQALPPSAVGLVFVYWPPGSLLLEQQNIR